MSVMAFSCLVSAVLFIGCCSCTVSLPFLPSRQASSTEEVSSGDYTSLPVRVIDHEAENFSPLVNISIVKDHGTCAPPDSRIISTDMGCTSETYYGDVQKDRIPQFIPHVRCVSRFPSFKYRTGTFYTCETVRHNVIVILLYHRSTENGISHYKLTLNSVSVACIRSIARSSSTTERTPISVPMERPQ